MPCKLSRRKIPGYLNSVYPFEFWNENTIESWGWKEPVSSSCQSTNNENNAGWWPRYHSQSQQVHDLKPALGRLSSMFFPL